MKTPIVAPIDVRDARSRDRQAVAELGHPPDIVRTFCPSFRTRLVWRIGAIRVRNFLNEVSLEAHRCLGFQEAAEMMGTAILGALSTLGPPAPAARLERVTHRGQSALSDLHALAMGSAWCGLFPGVEPRRFLAYAVAPSIASPMFRRLLGEWRAEVLCAWTIGAMIALAVRRGNTLSLYLDPRTCDATWLARIAQRLVAHGMPRDQVVSLYGIPRALVDRAGVIRRRALMTMEDVSLLRSSPGSVSGRREPPCLL